MFGVHTLVVQANESMFFAMMIFQDNKTFPDNKNEERIFNHIFHNPGCITSNISNKFELSNGTIRYYIKKLENNGKIVQRKFGKFNRLYSRRPALTDIEMLLFSFIANGTNKDLLIAIVNNQGITNHELSKKLDLEKSNIHRRLKTLLKDKIITSKYEGRIKRYDLNEKYYEVVSKIIR